MKSFIESIERMPSKSGLISNRLGTFLDFRDQSSVLILNHLSFLFFLHLFESCSLLCVVLALGAGVNEHAPELIVNDLAFLLSEALLHESLYELLLGDGQDLLATLEGAEGIAVNLLAEHFNVLRVVH